MLPQTSLAHILEKKEKLDMARSGRLVRDKYQVDTWAGLILFVKQDPYGFIADPFLVICCMAQLFCNSIVPCIFRFFILEFEVIYCFT